MAEDRTTKFYEIEIKNRVVRGFMEQPILGTQGKWYPETLYYLAESEQEARELASKSLESRRIYGVPITKAIRKSYKRQIKILNIRRIA